MEPKLVYRTLRKISDWTVNGYYSQVWVEGQENVPADGPLIIASTHHNEIIDSATLTVTIPHGRHISFWAKASMFVNPLARAIMESSGAIPVRRNPNKSSPHHSRENSDNPNCSSNSHDNHTNSEADTEHCKNNEHDSQDNGNGKSNDINGTNGTNGTNSTDSVNDLFHATLDALEKGEVVGVFPEGTSYTEPEILQVLPGAAKAAVEYVKWMRYRQGHTQEEKQRTKLKIIPVGIVYTDKSRYHSRVCVRYGEPIEVDEYADEIMAADGCQDELMLKGIVTKITGEIERKLREMTINAPDWDTLYAARMARSMLSENECNIPLKNWIPVSQAYIRILSNPLPENLGTIKSALTSYFALLHHTGIDHSILEALLPRAANDSDPHSRSLAKLLTPSPSVLYRLPLALVRLALFAPTLIVYVPAYLSGWLAAKTLAAKGEEEAQAQFRGVGGEVGLGMAFGLALGWLWRSLGKWGIYEVLPLLSYAGIFSVVKWHNALVDGNYKMLRRVIVFWKLLVGLVMPSCGSVDISAYCRLSVRPRNRYIKRRRDAEPLFDSPSTPQAPTPVASWKLIRHLLVARLRAQQALGSLVGSLDSDTLYFLEQKGGLVDL
ncbi:hypothetical protein AX17_006003 [Amanita inopinata Kibby_2008]|nr:hypothetical protein AX17_006003 [Amanita inopinata Kibby_2008]